MRVVNKRAFISRDSTRITHALILILVYLGIHEYLLMEAEARETCLKFSVPKAANTNM